MLSEIMVLQLLINVFLLLSCVPSIIYTIVLLNKRDMFSHRAVRHMQQICESGYGDELK